ncbi:uncharacterized protein LOC118466912 isoform X2 [Anopheles albimanus]|uniref:uncharacterized protein LOC118466912 isoform X2 n=1 Tax=Anopheles albimanus TaxID=7167 RepID=UPI001642312D|nr:uncharacterized protein LOC118466912 isoform X2 [Anopheles albimanus]
MLPDDRTFRDRADSRRVCDRCSGASPTRWRTGGRCWHNRSRAVVRSLLIAFLCADFTTQSTASTTHDRVLFTDTPVMDAITIIWYLATFIALISFFLVMACADRNRCRSRKPVDPEVTPPPTPAPSYRLFAPPSYDSLELDKDTDSIFIIPYDSRSVSTDDPQRCAEGLASTLEYIIERPAPADPAAVPVASDITPSVGGAPDLVEVTSVPVHPTLR